VSSEVTSAERLERRAAIQRDRVARYDRMFEIRVFEERVNSLFYEGLVHGTTHLCLGQEAISVGVASAIEVSDTVACTYRGHGAGLALGLSPVDVLGEIMGRTIGPVGGLGGSMHLSDPDIGLLPTFAIIGAGIPVAAGAALTAQVLGTGAVAVSIFGDGASNIGAFHEGINLAAIWKLPVVFVCENNVYGEYSRIDMTTPIEDIADRAVSYGIPGTVVDGQDIDKVRDSMATAVARARDGGGPSLLEMKTYRYAGHSRADTAPYRPEGEYEAWYERDPLNAYRARLIDEGRLTADTADALETDVRSRVEDAVTVVSAAPKPDVSAMFAHLLA